MNTESTREKTTNAQGELERMVETTDYRPLAGQGQEQKGVQVIHTETTNAQGEVERRVETTDYRSSAGQGQEQKSVQVIHQSHPQRNSNTSGGVLAAAAAAVASTLQSAKDAISGK